MADRIITVRFDSPDGNTTAAMTTLRNLGFELHIADESSKIIILERRNPDWDFNPSFFRLFKYLMRFHGMSHLEVRDPQ